MAQAYNLTTKTKVKLHTGIDGTTDDTLLDQLCDNITAFIEKYCGGTRFYKTLHEDEIHDGSEGKYLRLAHRYIYQDYVIKVEYNSGNNVSPNWVELSANEYEVYPDAGVLYMYEKIAGKRNIRITYIAGSVTIPYDLELSATLMVGRMYNKRKSLGLTNESFEGVSQNWSDVMTEAELQTLNSYRQPLV